MSVVRKVAPSGEIEDVTEGVQVMRFILGAFGLSIVNGVAVNWAQLSSDASMLIALIVGIGYSLTGIATRQMR